MFNRVAVFVHPVQRRKRHLRFSCVGEIQRYLLEREQENNGLQRILEFET